MAHSSRSDDSADVGSRSVPLFDRASMGSNWLGAAFFLGLAGAFHELGLYGLAYPFGWLGGCLLADALIAPRLRRFGRYTLPDFLGARYGNHATRRLGLLVLLSVLFLFLIAQLYGIGLVVERQPDVGFEVAAFGGLATALVCVLFSGLQRMCWLPVAIAIVAIVTYAGTGMTLNVFGTDTQLLPVPAADTASTSTDLFNIVPLAACLIVGIAALPRIGMRAIAAPSPRATKMADRWDFLIIGPTMVFASAFLIAADHGIDGDEFTLAAPAIAGISPVFTALIAIGALAILLLTATRLLRTILSLLTDEKPGTDKSARTIAAIAGMVLIGVAAAYAASTKPASILTMMAWGLSLAASGLFAPLVLGLWWKRTSTLGAAFGLAAGFGICLFYLIGTQYFPDRFAALFGSDAWWGIDNVAAGLFGIPVALAVTVIVSLVTPAPSPEMQEFVASLRRPRGMPANRARSAE